MDRAVATLSLPERLLIEQTEPRALAALDEDHTADLLLQVRRARNKYSKLYRRRAGAQVVADASRANGSAKNQRTREKAEVFENALARVSRRLAALARQSAAELRAERLADAKAARSASARAPRRRATDQVAVDDVGRQEQDAGQPEAHRVDQGDRRPAPGQARQPLTEPVLVRRMRAWRASA